MATLLFKFVFLSNASPAVVLTSTELTGGTAPTVNISTVAIADGTTIASVVAGGALVYDTNTKSWSYRLASADLATYCYTGMATTTYATASPASVHALGIVVPDELISTRSTATTAGIADAVWDELSTGHVSAGKAGEQLWTDIDAIKVATDTIGTGTTLTIVSPIASSLLTVTIGGTLAATVSGLTLSASWTLMDFTLKRSADDTDANAILRIRVSNPAVGTTDGALIVEGVAATVAQRTLAGLTVTQAAGTVAIAATAVLTGALSTHAALVWDLKQWTAAAQTVVATGSALVQHTPTWAVT